MKRMLLLLLLVLAFIALAVVGTRAKRPAQAQEIACADPLQGCVFTHRGRAAQLRFFSQPEPMQPFRMELHVPSAQHASAQVQMVGMDMGFNRYDLHTTTHGIFNAEITLPVCVSGRRDWKLYLQVDSQRYVVPFSSK